jgi:hypothetical protein
MPSGVLRGLDERFKEVRVQLPNRSQRRLTETPRGACQVPQSLLEAP